MLWSSAFIICFIQGIFLLFLINKKVTKNNVAKNLLIILISIFLVYNLGYLTIHTDLRFYIPHLFGLQMGLTFFIGPLIYLYSRAVLDPRFVWRNIYVLHFIPYLIRIAFTLNYFFLDKKIWIEFISEYLKNNLFLSNIDLIGSFVELTHLSLYLIFTIRFVKKMKDIGSSISYLTTLKSRINWINSLIIGFSLMLFIRIFLLVFVLIKGKLNPVTNYIHTIVITSIIYFITYYFSSKPEIISPSFDEKYNSYKNFLKDEEEKYLKRLIAVFEEKKMFLNPEFKLKSLASELKLPEYKISRLINEKFNKSFSELVNDYRVKEFIYRVNDPKYSSYSILGIAFDIGFKSKSAFNSSFKKHTGKSPSDFRNNESLTQKISKEN